MFRVRSLVALVGLVFVALATLAPGASAQTDDQYPLDVTPPTVLGTDFQQGDPPAVASGSASVSASASASAAQVQGQTLPVTGSDIVGLSVLGLVAVGAGFALVRYQRSAATRV